MFVIGLDVKNNFGELHRIPPMGKKLYGETRNDKFTDENDEMWYINVAMNNNLSTNFEICSKLKLVH